MNQIAMAAAWIAILLVGMASHAPCSAHEEQESLSRTTVEGVKERPESMIEISGAISDTLQRALTEAGFSRSSVLEIVRALETVIELETQLQRYDRFYVRFRSTVRANMLGPIEPRHIAWVQLESHIEGPFSIYRFAGSETPDRFWLPNGAAATKPRLRLPLDKITVSSGFGWRFDPFHDSTVHTAYQRTPRVEIPGSNRLSRLVERRVALVSSPAPLVNVPTKRGIAMGLSSGGKGLTGSRGAIVVHNGRGAKVMHNGIDLVVPVGTAVLAAGDGVVRGAAVNGGYGNWILIEHADNLSTEYGHLEGFAVGLEEGARVLRGQIIGYVGNSGRSTGAHLHFGTLRNGVPVDPSLQSEFKPDVLPKRDLARFLADVERLHQARLVQATSKVIVDHRGLRSGAATP